MLPAAQQYAQVASCGRLLAEEQPGRAAPANTQMANCALVEILLLLPTSCRLLIGWNAPVGCLAVQNAIRASAPLALARCKSVAACGCAERFQEDKQELYEEPRLAGEEEEEGGDAMVRGGPLAALEPLPTSVQTVLLLLPCPALPACLPVLEVGLCSKWGAGQLVGATRTACV